MLQGHSAQRVLFQFLVAISAGQLGVSQLDNLNARVDRVFARYDRSDSPGCSLAVVKDGKIVYKHGYGMADLEHDIHITDKSVFYVGSVSKQFTAFSAALLIQEHKLSLEDDIRKYLAEMPDYGIPITVRDLIYHTSGLREYLTHTRIDEVRDNQDVLKITASQRDLLFNPGDQYQYSNTGYTLIAIIVERVARVPFSQFVAEKILRPLGMKDSHFHSELTRLVKNRAYGYDPGPGAGVLAAPPVPNRVGAGGLFTTVNDLFQWDQSLYDGRLGQPGLIRLLETPAHLNNGSQLEAGFGLEIRNYRGLRVVEHGGSHVGYRAQFTRFPEKKFSVICLCNMSNIDAQQLVRQVADIYLADQYK